MYESEVFAKDNNGLHLLETPRARLQGFTPKEERDCGTRGLATGQKTAALLELLAILHQGVSAGETPTKTKEVLRLPLFLEQFNQWLGCIDKILKERR